MNSDLEVKILNINKEIELYTNVKFIRILSDKYNLLIMKNYIPIIGEINGSIEIDGDNSVKKEKIKGYYINRNNKFDLIIKEEL